MLTTVAASPVRALLTTVARIAEPKAAPMFWMMRVATAAADQKIIGAIGKVAEERGVSRAQISLAWLYRNPVVDVAPLVLFADNTPKSIF